LDTRSALLLVFGFAAAVFVGYRVALWRQVREVGGLKVLERLHWETLLEELPEPSRQEVLGQLLAGQSAAVLEEVWGRSGVSVDPADWIRILVQAVRTPRDALATLRARTGGSAKETYLTWQLTLGHDVGAVLPELTCLRAKHALGQALARFGPLPALFGARALASAKMGRIPAAIDDLARAVYYSNQGTFFLRAVLDTPYIESVRPGLVQRCREALAQQGQSG
jgi:hypothetical protein